MIHCVTCDSRKACRSSERCAQGYTLVQRYEQQHRANNPVTSSPIMDVADPIGAIVDAPALPTKPPAPINEPKGPMSTLQENTTRTRWAMIAVAAINAILLALGLQGVDAGPVIDALVLGEWGNAIALVLAILGAFFSRQIARAFPSR